MPDVHVKTKISAPIEEVFRVFTDFENVSDRIDAIVNLELLTDGPIGKGTRFRETRVMFGKEATEEMEITDFQPHQSYRVEAESCGAHYVSNYRFNAEDYGTSVNMTFSATAQTLTAKLMWPLSFLMKGVVKKCLHDDLASLKLFLEGSATPV